MVELSEVFYFFAIHPTLALKHNNGIRMALNFSESNLEKNDSELIEYKREDFGEKRIQLYHPSTRRNFDDYTS